MHEPMPSARPTRPSSSPASAKPCVSSSDRQSDVVHVSSDSAAAALVAAACVARPTGPRAHQLVRHKATAYGRSAAAAPAEDSSATA